MRKLSDMKYIYDAVSFETSKVITHSYSTSFSTAVSLLPTDTRKAIYGVYGFVRLADEIVDTFDLSGNSALFDEFSSDLYLSLTRGTSVNPVIHAFVQVVNTYEIGREYIDAFMKSMRADLHKRVYYNKLETEEYIYGSAVVVGLMCLKVFVNGDKDQFNVLKEPAMMLGSAFQKVNFLRDLRNDYSDLSRVYFTDVTLDNFSESRKLELISEIEHEFKLAKYGVDQLPGKSKLAVLVAYLYYKRLLDKLRESKTETILTQRIRVSDIEKVGLFVKANLLYRLNLY